MIWGGGFVQRNLRRAELEALREGTRGFDIWMGRGRGGDGARG